MVGRIVRHVTGNVLLFQTAYTVLKSRRTRDRPWPCQIFVTTVNLKIAGINRMLDFDQLQDLLGTASVLDAGAQYDAANFEN